MLFLFFFNDTATTEIYTLSLHDALPISESLTCNALEWIDSFGGGTIVDETGKVTVNNPKAVEAINFFARSEEHTSELQSRQYLVCRLLLEKKKKNQRTPVTQPTLITCLS